MTQQASRDSTVLLQSIWFATQKSNLTKRSCLKSLLLNDSTSKPWLHSIAAEYMICYTEEQSDKEELFKIFPAEWLNKQAVTPQYCCRVYDLLHRGRIWLQISSWRQRTTKHEENKPMNSIPRGSLGRRKHQLSRVHDKLKDSRVLVASIQWPMSLNSTVS